MYVILASAPPTPPELADRTESRAAGFGNSPTKPTTGVKPISGLLGILSVAGLIVASGTTTAGPDMAFITVPFLSVN
jgi:hypothetical protein